MPLSTFYWQLKGENNGAVCQLGSLEFKMLTHIISCYKQHFKHKLREPLLPQLTHSAAEIVQGLDRQHAFQKMFVLVYMHIRKYANFL